MMLEHTKQTYQDMGAFVFKYTINKAFAGRGKGKAAPPFFRWTPGAESAILLYGVHTG